MNLFNDFIVKCILFLKYMLGNIEVDLNCFFLINKKYDFIKINLFFFFEVVC